MKARPRAAFDEARQQAQWDYGHAGYTGTIAEKTTFLMRSERPIEVRAAHTLANKLVDEDDPRISDKWGPAGCIKLATDKRGAGTCAWLFFGWASS